MKAPKKSRQVVYRNGIAFIDPVAAAKLLEANGVLDRARRHMRFYPVTIKGAVVSVPVARRSDPE